MDLTYCKSQRRKARAALRNYLVALKSEIRNDYGVVLPIESQLKNMNSAKFDEWFASVVNVFLENINHFSLAWHCHPSRKRMFLQSEQK